MKHNITPADCDGKCFCCPVDKECDHVRLNRSQKEYAVLLSYSFAIGFIAILILWVIK